MRSLLYAFGLLAAAALLILVDRSLSLTSQTKCRIRRHRPAGQGQQHC
jgi:hypothetical protein